MTNGPLYIISVKRALTMAVSAPSPTNMLNLPSLKMWSYLYYKIDEKSLWYVKRDLLLSQQRVKSLSKTSIEWEFFISILALFFKSYLSRSFIHEI